MELDPGLISALITLAITIYMPLTIMRNNYNERNAEAISKGEKPSFSEILKENIKILILLPFGITIIGVWFFIMNSVLVFLIPFVIAFSLYVLLRAVLDKDNL